MVSKSIDFTLSLGTIILEVEGAINKGKNRRILGGDFDSIMDEAKIVLREIKKQPMYFDFSRIRDGDISEDALIVVSLVLKVAYDCRNNIYGAMQDGSIGC